MRSLPRVLVAVIAVAVFASALVISGPVPQAAAFGPRVCENFYTGDGLRRLSVCSSIWISADEAQHRGLVEMHTYVGTRAGWVDSRSQSITLNLADFDQAGSGYTTWGTLGGAGTCRVNSPSGRIGCSVANTARVAFYSAGRPFSAISQQGNTVWRASWRDDLGVAHYVTENKYSYPDTMPVVYD